MCVLPMAWAVYCDENTLLYDVEARSLNWPFDLPLFFSGNFDLQLFLYMCQMSIIICFFSQVAIFTVAFLSKIDVQLFFLAKIIVFLTSYYFFSVKLRLLIVFFLQSNMSKNDFNS